MPDIDDNTCPTCGAKNQPGARACRICGAALNTPQPELVAAQESAVANKLSREITSITDPLLQMVAASPDELVIASLRRVLEESGPRQAEVLRRCAIPRWFDLAVLAVLREREDGNDRVLELLRGYSFVREVGGGRYAYHDSVRDVLLREWRAQRPDELRTLHLRLAEHFGERVLTAEGLRTLPKGSPSTTISSMPSGDWELWSREALYHRLMADPRDGMDRLHASFDQLEATHRLADAEALLQVARDVPLEEPERLWVRYLRARLAHASLRFEEAAEQLDSILAQPAIDPLLGAEARQTMGDIYAETGQWARAIDLYRESLGYFQASGKPQQAATSMLRLGEAYQGLGLNTGGWHVPAYPRSRFWNTLGRMWQWLLVLPFLLVGYFLRRTPWTLPLPDRLGSYQNWLLVRMYRTAQDWYERAHNAFKELGNSEGDLRAEQHLAEILLIFGYAGDALARLNALREQTAARDPYARLWIDCGRAAALLDQGHAAEARAILDSALPQFQEIGDVRREAAVLALQAHAAEVAEDQEAALELYRRSLSRFRALRYTAAREQALYALRAWRRHVGPGAISRQIGALLAEEPEKRYVARFPRRQLPLLRVLSLITIPLALLLLALVLPSQTLRPAVAGGLPELLTIYSPWRAILVLGVLLLLYSASYTVVALAVIFFIPMAALEREQPDYLITDPDGIARYDYQGALAQRMRWSEIQRWIRVDRRIWERPLPLFSLTFLEAADGRDMLIDGITGWYTSVQDDIGQHLGDAGNPTKSEDLGFRVLRSKMSILPAIGLPLLILFVLAESGAARWLIRLLPPQVYAVCSLIVFSGALFLIPLAYWLAAKPLALNRALGLENGWPLIIGAIGLGAIGFSLLGNSGTFMQSRALYVGLLLWGTYIAADAATTLWAPKNPARTIIVVAALALAGYVAWPRTWQIYYTTLSQVAAQAADEQATGATPPGALAPGSAAAQAVQAGDVIAQEEQYSPEQKAQAALNSAKAYYKVGDYRGAVAAYDEALSIYNQLSPAKSESIRQEIAVALAGRARSLQKLGSSQWEQDLELACQYDSSVAEECRGR
jgi:tetratricopeptide (TPR) repeat protein